MSQAMVKERRRLRCGSMRPTLFPRHEGHGWSFTFAGWPGACARTTNPRFGAERHLDLRCVFVNTSVHVRSHGIRDGARSSRAAPPPSPGVFFARVACSDIGSRLWNLLMEAGFERPDCRAEYPISGGSDTVYYEWIAESFRSIHPRAIA